MNEENKLELDERQRRVSKLKNRLLTDSPNFNSRRATIKPQYVNLAQSAWDNARAVFSSGHDPGTPISNYDAFKVRANFTTKNWGAGFN